MAKPGDIELQIMWNRLIAVVEEQAQTLLRTAFSAIVREAGDLSAGIFDPHGRILAQAVTGTPGHVNSMAESVKHFIATSASHYEPAPHINNDPGWALATSTTSSSRRPRSTRRANWSLCSPAPAI
jgi:N-methylhydantoinase B